MGLRRSRRFLVFSIICIVAIIAGVVRFSGKRWLTVDLEESGYGIPAQSSTSVVGQYGKLTLPYSFMVGRVNELTMHKQRLYTTVTSGFVLFGFESAEPVDCMVVLDDEPSWGFDRQVDAVLVNLSGCYEFYDVLEIGERGVLSFCFKADTETLSNVTLMAAKDAWFTKHWGSSLDVNEVDTEAAAATGIVAELGSVFPTKVFRADSPFIYMILDKETGSILFMGRVIDPST